MVVISERKQKSHAGHHGETKPEKAETQKTRKHVFCLKLSKISSNGLREHQLLFNNKGRPNLGSLFSREPRKGEWGTGPSNSCVSRCTSKLWRLILRRESTAQMVCSENYWWQY